MGSPFSSKPVVSKFLFSVGAASLLACSGASRKESLDAKNSVSPSNGASVSQVAPVCPPAAPPVFTNAVCLCEDLNDVGSGLITKASAGGSANVGVNGNSHVVGRFDIEGSWVAYKGLSGTGNVGVRDDVTTTGSVSHVDQLSVGHDLSVGGDLSDVGQLAVAGTLRVQGTDHSIGSNNVAAKGPYTAPAGPPCGCDSSVLDISGQVAAAKLSNDNASLGLGTSIEVLGTGSVTLKSGHYYFEGIHSVGQLHVTADGAVSIYVDGSIQTVGDDAVTLTPGSTLDLYVSGSVQQVGRVNAGEHMDPGAFRLYVGGADPVVVAVGDQHLHGSIYAPNATLGFVGDTLVHGAIVAKTLNAVGALEVMYEAPSPDTCTVDAGTPPPPDAGTGLN